MTYEKYKGPKIQRPQDIAPILRAILNTEDEIDRDKEHFYGVGLDNQNKIQYVELISLGTANASLVHPREVLRERSISSRVRALHGRTGV